MTLGKIMSVNWDERYKQLKKKKDIFLPTLSIKYNVSAHNCTPHNYIMKSYIK